MKKFYKLVSVEETSEGYGILLDGRPVKTKAGMHLRAPSKGIADLIMAEWGAQTEEIIPDTMPMTQIINTRIDRVSVDRDVMRAAVLKYFDTDLICYFTDVPQELKAVQEKHWNPVLLWFEKKFGMALETTTTLTALTQCDNARDKVCAYIDSLDNDRFTILQIVTAASGSLILALAFVDGGVGAQAVFDACYVEETYKEALYGAEKHGSDPLLEKAKAAMQRDLNAAHSYLSLL